MRGEGEVWCAKCTSLNLCRLKKVGHILLDVLWRETDISDEIPPPSPSAAHQQLMTHLIQLQGHGRTRTQSVHTQTQLLHDAGCGEAGGDEELVFSNAKARIRGQERVLSPEGSQTLSDRSPGSSVSTVTGNLLYMITEGKIVQFFYAFIA